MDKCRALDGKHVATCDFKAQKERAEQDRLLAQKASFMRKVQNKPGAVNAIRLMLKARAETEQEGYCNRFNQSGIPCAGCKFYPCSQWEELMEEDLAQSIYKDMPNAIRTKNKRAKPAGRGRAGGLHRRGPPLQGCVLVDDEEDEF